MENHMLPAERDGERRGKQVDSEPHLQQTLPWTSSPEFSVGRQKQSLSPLPTYPPPAYTHPALDPVSLSASNAPLPTLAPIQQRFAHHENSTNSLPSFAALTGSSLASHNSSLLPAASPSPPSRTEPWPSLNPLTAYYAPSNAAMFGSPSRMDSDAASMGTTSVASPGGPRDARAASVNLDDPDVRLAAEALGDLRADFVSSPPARGASRSINSPERSNPQNHNDREPLLALLTTSHPLLATTIEGATSVYTQSKNFSPRFKSGAEYVEGYLTPIANTVGSVSRVTGVEGGVRWFLGGNVRRPHSSASDLEAAHVGSNKRRKIDGVQRSSRASNELQSPAATSTLSNDPFAFTKDRRSSMSTVDTLPAYDDARSPAYEFTDGQNGTRTPTTDRPAAAGSSSAWQSRLIMSTSGLSIAMSEESLRSLKYCLQWLRWANDHIAGVVDTLKSTIDRYDRGAGDVPREGTPGTSEPPQTHNDAPMASHATLANPLPAADRPSPSEVAGRVAAMRNDVLKTLRDVIETVSRYAGGALPENARILVRKHLTSLPRRFQLASQVEADTSALKSDSAAGPETETGIREKEKEVRDGAQRVLVLAKEGLDMMAQVSGVLDGTIVSAEEWCERLGRKTREQRDTLLSGSGTSNGDSGILPAEEPSAPTTEALEGISIDGDVKMG